MRVGMCLVHVWACVWCVRAYKYIKDECIFAPQSMRTSRTISILQLLAAGKHATTLGHLLQCGMQYDIVLGIFALADKVLEHLSVVSQNTVLVSSGEPVISQCNVSPIIT